VLGHVFPIFYGFKGGKGVLVAATMTLMLCPMHFIILLLVFAIIVVISRYVSLGSIVVATLLPISVCIYIPLACGAKLPMIIAISLIFLGGFVVWCHRSNIKRLLAGNEKKISIGGKKKKND
jgi:glycerol-3-phosphate acyltransferase PlsY